MIVDIDWYLATQILPPVQRLVEPIEGVTSEAMAEALGLDASKFRTYNVASNAEPVATEVILGEDPNRFSNCERVVLECPECNRTFSYVGDFWLPEVSTL